mmetsp:Transcript_32810/g.38490  ORF Transcript_32810/g.38490 Transcript_32810/m.38490 type:complete len:175 (-) Transcript_32810:2417-2941(-)
MEKERYNYIVLDSESGGGAVDENKVQWDADTWTATWNIYDYLFSEYEYGDDVYIELISSSFTCQPYDEEDIAIQTFSTNATVQVSDVFVNNQKSTNTKQILDIIPTSIFVNSLTNEPDEYSVSSTNQQHERMKLKVNKFNKISFNVKQDDLYLNLTTSNIDYRFILKVSYQKNN